MRSDIGHEEIWKLDRRHDMTERGQKWRRWRRRFCCRKSQYGSDQVEESNDDDDDDTVARSQQQQPLLPPPPSVNPSLSQSRLTCIATWCMSWDARESFTAVPLSSISSACYYFAGFYNRRFSSEATWCLCSTNLTSMLRRRRRCSAVQQRWLRFRRNLLKAADVPATAIFLLIITALSVN